MQGIAGQWKGTYGFIELRDGRRLFVHYSDIAGSGYRQLTPGDRVEFEIMPDEQGRQRATRVCVVEEAA